MLKLCAYYVCRCPACATHYYCRTTNNYTGITLCLHVGVVTSFVILTDEPPLLAFHSHASSSCDHFSAPCISVNTAIMWSFAASCICCDMFLLLTFTWHPTSANVHSTTVSGHSSFTWPSTVDRLRVR